MTVTVRPTLNRASSGNEALVTLTVDDRVIYLSLECSAELRSSLEACEEKARAALAMTKAEQDLMAAQAGGRA